PLIERAAVNDPMPAALERRFEHLGDRKLGVEGKNRPHGSTTSDGGLATDSRFHSGALPGRLPVVGASGQASCRRRKSCPPVQSETRRRIWREERPMAAIYLSRGRETPSASAVILWLPRMRNNVPLQA